MRQLRRRFAGDFAGAAVRTPQLRMDARRRTKAREAGLSIAILIHAKVDSREKLIIRLPVRG